MFGAVFVVFVLLAACLGGFVGRRIVAPIRELAGVVTGNTYSSLLLGRKDELGILARAHAAHKSEQRAFLDRERFFMGDVIHELRTPLTVIMEQPRFCLKSTAVKACALQRFVFIVQRKKQ